MCLGIGPYEAELNSTVLTLQGVSTSAQFPKLRFDIPLESLQITRETKKQRLGFFISQALCLAFSVYLCVIA